MQEVGRAVGFNSRQPLILGHRRLEHPEFWESGPWCRNDPTNRDDVILFKENGLLCFGSERLQGYFICQQGMVSGEINYFTFWR